MDASAFRPAFAGSIPQLYEQYLVPMIFAPYAEDLATRVAAHQPGRVLEVAAGTGALTRQLARVLPSHVEIIASDLSQPMLDVAAATTTERPITWCQADALMLPFPDGSFDVVVCQFGVMFFPDKPRAFSEARRVLRPGGQLLFNVWDRLEHNEFADTVSRAVATLFPQNPPGFMARVPHGDHEPALIADHLRQGGFTQVPNCTTLAARSHADCARTAAVAFCQGTPLRGEIEARGPSRLPEATDHAAGALTARFGAGRIEGRLQAHIMALQR